MNVEFELLKLQHVFNTSIKNIEDKRDIWKTVIILKKKSKKKINLFRTPLQSNTKHNTLERLMTIISLISG